MKTWTSKGLALPSRSDVKPVAGRPSFLAQRRCARPWQFAPGFAKVMTVAGNELTAAIEGKQSIDRDARQDRRPRRPRRCAADGR